MRQGDVQKVAWYAGSPALSEAAGMLIMTINVCSDFRRVSVSRGSWNGRSQSIILYPGYIRSRDLSSSFVTACSCHEVDCFVIFSED